MNGTEIKPQVLVYDGKWKNQTLETDIKTKLDELANLQAKMDAIALEKKAAIDKILTPEIKAQIEAVDDKYDDQAGETAGKIFLLEQEITGATLTFGSTVKGDRIQVVYMSGRTTWDGKALIGYAAAHPEINAFRHAGEPYVSFKAVKESS